MYVLGRDHETGPTARLGRYRARDGSAGASVGLDLDTPHVALVVGKRGSGKSYTLGVLAEALARASGVTPAVVDPMGVFGSLAASGVVEAREPTVRAAALGPRAWCRLLGLDPESPAGTLVWRAATERETLAGMRGFVADADATPAARRGARNHLDLATTWGVFGDGEESRPREAGAWYDLAGVDRAAANAVCAGLASGLYRRCVTSETGPLPWLLLDEAHAFFAGVAARGLRRLLTRGRQPGVSLVAATQRPGALPEVALSQADLLVVHRLTSEADREALAAARPAYMSESFAARMPTEPGEALVVDDRTETVHAVRVRERETPHDGGSPRAANR